jgi:Ran GTPase-activating protein (RanGAP) involved in mRNA processing and transport
MSLKQLHLQFCNLTSDAGVHLSDLLANTRTSLEVLNVSGNRLGGKGLRTLCKGLSINTKLETLLLADNMIDHQTPDDIDGLTAFRDCLNNPNVNVSTVDLMYNRIGKKNADF